VHLYLVRHATCDPVGHRLAGRAPGVSLNAAGRAQARALAAHLAGARLDAVASSPLARALETASAIARPHGLVPSVEPGLLELGFGDWTGRAIDGLRGEERWTHFNAYRSGTRAPGGELALEAQARAVAAVLRLAAERPDARVAVVSHADVLKAVLGHLLGVPLDLQHRLEIAPASVSEAELHPWGARVLAVNAAVPPAPPS
jgi:probable phosphoglycerate mutase